MPSSLLPSGSTTVASQTDRAHISISTAPQAQPFAIAIRSLQREAIRLDTKWNLGNYDDEE